MGLLAFVVFTERWRDGRELSVWKATMRANGEKITAAEILGKPSTNQSYVPVPMQDLMWTKSLLAGSWQPLPAVADAPGQLVVRHLDVAYFHLDWTQHATYSSWEMVATNLAEWRPVLDELHEVLGQAQTKAGSAASSYRKPSTGLANNCWPVILPVSGSLAAAVVDDLHRGDRDHAITDLESLISLIQLLHDYPDFYLQYLRLHLSITLWPLLWEALQAEEWNDAELARLQTAVRAVSFLDVFQRTVELERANSLAQLQRVRETGGATGAFLPTYLGAQIVNPAAVALDDGLVKPIWRMFWSDQQELFFLKQVQPGLDQVRQAAVDVARTLTSSAVVTGILPPIRKPPPAEDKTAETMPISIEDASLIDAIKTLARQAGVNLIFAPHRFGAVDFAEESRTRIFGWTLQNRQGSRWQVAWQTNVVNFRWENLSAETALMAVVDNWGLALVRDPATTVARVMQVSDWSCSYDWLILTNRNQFIGRGMTETGESAGEKLSPIRLENVLLQDAITAMARQAGVNCHIDAFWKTNNSRVTVFWENLTARTALARLLAEHRLVMMGNPHSGIYMLQADPGGRDLGQQFAHRSRGSSLVSMAPAGGQDPNPDDLPALTIEDAPVLDAVQTLARQAGIGFVMDPRVAAGLPDAKGHPTLTALISFRWEHITAGQALTAILKNFNLLLATNASQAVPRLIERPSGLDAPGRSLAFFNRFRFERYISIWNPASNYLPWVLESETDRELTVTAIALRRFQLRHGRAAATLLELVPEFLPTLPRDYMNGEALHYRAASDGSFLLYSVGVDGWDEGGDPNPANLTRPWTSRWSGRDAVWESRRRPPPKSSAH